MKHSLLTLALAIIAFLSPALSSAKNAAANPKPFTALNCANGKAE